MKTSDFTRIEACAHALNSLPLIDAILQGDAVEVEKSFSSLLDSEHSNPLLVFLSEIAHRVEEEPTARTAAEKFERLRDLLSEEYQADW